MDLMMIGSTALRRARVQVFSARARGGGLVLGARSFAGGRAPARKTGRAPAQRLVSRGASSNFCGEGRLPTV